MSSETIPEWATEEAGKIADVWQHPMHHDHQILSQDIARDLLAAEQRGLEKAATLIEQGYDRPVATPWSANGASKNDLCPHGMAVYQDCEQCAAAAIRSLGDKI